MTLSGALETGSSVIGAWTGTASLHFIIVSITSKRRRALGAKTGK